MTDYAYNGWPVIRDTKLLTELKVRTESFGKVLAGDVHTVLSHVAEQLDARVEPVDLGHPQDDWGWVVRANTNNTSQWSVHAAACCFDYNATRHPNGRRDTFTAAQFREIDKILAEVLNVVVQLRGYDEMHFEIKGTKAQVAAAAAFVRALRALVSMPGTPAPGLPSGIAFEPRNDVAPGARTIKLGSVGTDVDLVQRWHGLVVDGEFGRRTDEAVRNTQGRNGLAVDGVVGPKTWALLGVGKAAPAPKPAPAPAPAPVPAEKPTLKQGSKGEAVKILQAKLKKDYALYRHEHGEMVVDGDFGATTNKWVREFQGRAGLTADGVVGAKTWKALGL